MANADHGNYSNDIQVDAAYGYGLLWVVWLASGMAMLLQYLSGKQGIATEQSLLDLILEKLAKHP
jgi:manganese transport protein